MNNGFFNEEALNIKRLLGHGKGGYSYLTDCEGREVVLKQLHHEPCDYYAFGNKMEAEINDYKRLKKAGIRIPELMVVNEEKERIIKEYIEGLTISEMLEEGLSVDQYLPQVREMAALAQKAGLNIDYYPTNFVVHDDLLYYIDYECNEYMEKWDFENWGRQYWQPKEEIKAEKSFFLDTSDLVNNEILLKLDRTADAIPEKSYVPAYYFNICLLDGTPIGYCDLRIGHNELLYLGGNIGYGIDEAYRGHHYALQAVKLLFTQARKHGMDRLFITCVPENKASSRTCELAGGKYVETAPIPPENNMYEEGKRQVMIYEFTL